MIRVLKGCGHRSCSVLDQMHLDVGVLLILSCLMPRPNVRMYVAVVGLHVHIHQCHQNVGDAIYLQPCNVGSGDELCLPGQVLWMSLDRESWGSWMHLRCGSLVL